MHLVYSDGLRIASVIEQRGRWSGQPIGWRYDTSLGAYRHDGLPLLASWQSASTLFTVVTDPGSDLASLVAGLPHEPSPPRTTMGRVQAGWARILDEIHG